MTTNKFYFSITDVNQWGAIMSDGLVSTKGQVVIPKSLRDAFGIEPGSKIRFANENGKLVAHVVSRSLVPSLDVLLTQARKLAPPEFEDFGSQMGAEFIDDGWVAPRDALEMDTDTLIAAWNTQARAAKSA
jgi:AbrB family looped-hinge helix DNA binding protein